MQGRTATLGAGVISEVLVTVQDEVEEGEGLFSDFLRTEVEGDGDLCQGEQAKQ
jgi:hypothetical protein